ncbi:arsenite methyltransferase [Folsomia candida]|uniref:Arsenite methyltransferase n=1 Tax=Folsomia candida TaxID=158441 RepID=A0A226ECQ6_FOLCA|nr:arsenite methyltransferase [Folsomia candida]OXA55363.1 putative arsenite methyltransferase [Folsomia candida]
MTSTTTCCKGKPVTEEDVQLKASVRKAYAEVAVKNSAGKAVGIQSSCCGAPKEVDIEYCKKFLGYTDDDMKTMVDGANMGLGCGNPTAIAELKEGQVVLDLGSGGGFDCFLAAKKVGKTGTVIGVDMTPEMLHKARLNARKGGYTNVSFRLGEIEHLPVADNTVDAIISNCVINLATDKAQVIREAARVLRRGGRLAISDIVATSPLPEEIKQDLELYNGCMAGATPVGELKEALENAGFTNISIQVNEESRQFIEKWSHIDRGVQNYVASAIIEAAKM